MNDTLKVGKTRTLQNASDAVYYCFNECISRGDGCACDCKVRRHFGIPPYGPKWPDQRDGKDGRHKNHGRPKISREDLQPEIIG